MTKCRSIRGWLHRDTDGLTEAERLVLEDHLATCAACRRDREQLALIRELGGALPAESIGPRGHQRAIARAFLEGTTPPEPAGASRRWMIALAAAAVAAVIAAIAIVAPGRGADRRAQPTADRLAPPPPIVPGPAPVGPAPEPAASPASIRSGQLHHDDVVLATGASVPPRVRVRATQAATVAVPGGAVALAAASEVRWDPDAQAMHLDTGTLDAEIDPAAAIRLRVITPEFTVEVTGTVFQTTTTGVSVSRGSVRVTDPDGMLITNLAAGESWRVPDPPASATANAATWLARARRAYADGELTRAERHADAALAAGPDRAQSAEARTILAECAQAAGRLDDAAARYRAIVKRYAGEPAAETALFAAARLEASRGRTAAARTLFEQYLARHPSGRFADDARERLQATP